VRRHLLQTKPVVFGEGWSMPAVTRAVFMGNGSLPAVLQHLAKQG
jgi:hypothetical protein